MTTAVATQLVMYDTDAVDVSYTDGSRLQVAPCGAGFVWLCPPARGSHPLHGERRVQQRTPYVTSAFRPLVREALDFRNRFSERPYLCGGALCEEAMRTALAHRVREIAWKRRHLAGDVTALPDGGKRVESVDGYARVTLAPSRQMITVEHLAPVPDPEKREGHGEAQGHDTRDISASVSRPGTSADVTRASTVGPLSTIAPASDMSTRLVESGAGWDSVLLPGRGRHAHAWVTKHYSVTDCPDAWSHPLRALLAHDARVVTVTEDTDTGPRQVETRPPGTGPPGTHVDGQEEESDDGEPPVVVCALPESLPGQCRYQHRHRYAESTEGGGGLEGGEGQGPVSVVCLQGVIYRLLTRPRDTVEVYPGDGSVLRSTGHAGHYFQHYYLHEGRLEEKTYSVRHPPPRSVGGAYSVAAIIGTGARLLEMLAARPLGGGACCWRLGPPAPPREPLSAALLEEQTFPGLGRFSAYTSGRVRVLFNDRTALDMRADFSLRVHACAAHSEDGDHGNHTGGTVAPADLPRGVCRLMLPSGQYRTVRADSPGEGCARYVRAAEEWAAWVGTPPGERAAFYRGTVHDPDRRASVQRELARIQCFRYMVDNKILHGAPGERQAPSYQGDGPGSVSDDVIDCPPGEDGNAGTDSALSFDVVSKILQQNSAAVQDLDSFLSRP